MVVDLKNGMPEDCFDSHAEKGAVFLRYLENLVGGPEKFELFLFNYIDTFKHMSITTNDFEAFFKKYFKSHICQANNTIDWEAWYHKPGLPPIIPNYDTKLLKECEDVVEIILKNCNFSKVDVEALHIRQIVKILRMLFKEDPFSLEKIVKIKQLFDLPRTPSNERIRLWWYRLCIKAKWEDIIEPTLEWLGTVTTKWYMRRLYRELYNWELARPKAIQTFLESKHRLVEHVAKSISGELHMQ